MDTKAITIKQLRAEVVKLNDEVKFLDLDNARLKVRNLRLGKKLAQYKRGDILPIERWGEGPQLATLERTEMFDDATRTLNDGINDLNCDIEKLQSEYTTLAIEYEKIRERNILLELLHVSDRAAGSQTETEAKP